MCAHPTARPQGAGGSSPKTVATSAGGPIRPWRHRIQPWRPRIDPAKTATSTDRRWPSAKEREEQGGRQPSPTSARAGAPRVLGTPLGATRAAAPPRWGKASLGRRAAALASHPRLEPRELESRARSPAPAAAAALGQPRLGAAPPPRERGGRGRRCTRELGLGWRQYILAEAPARFWADGQNGTRTTDHESDGQNFFCYRGHASVASWPQRIYSLDLLKSPAFWFLLIKNQWS